MSEYSVPNNTEFLRMANRLKKMLPELEKTLKPIRPLIEGAKRNPELARNLTNVHQRVVHLADESALFKKREGKIRQQVKDIQAASKKAKELADEAAKKAKGLKKVIEDAKKGLDNINKGFFKGNVNPTASQWGNMGAMLAITGFVFYKTFVDEEINDISQAVQSQLSIDLTKAYSNISRAVLLSRRNTQDIEILKKEINKNNAEITKQNKKIAEARKLGNDGLAEARSYNKSLQQKITDFIRASQKEIQQAYKAGNDALYETRQGRAKLDTQIKQQNTIYTNQVEQLKQQFQKLTNAVGTSVNQSLGNTLTTIQKGIAEAKAEANKAKDYATTVAKTLELAKAITEATKQAVKIADTKAETALSEALKNGVTLKLIDGKIEIAAQNAAKTYTAKVWEPIVYSATQQIPVIANGLTNVAGDVAKFKEEAKNNLAKANTRIDSIDSKINTTQKEVEVTKKEIKDINTDLGKIDTKIRDIEKMDRQANEKLDKLVGGVSLLPPLIRSVGNDIKTNTPTIPQIETAAANGTCRSLQPGGCSRKALDDLGGNINANNNANANNILDAVNTGANAAQLTLLNTINGKLGEQLPGGISSFLTKFLERFNKVAEWLHLDRALNILIWWQTLHNAYMLSANLGQTLTSAVSNVLAAIGIKDAEGNPLEIGNIIGKTLDDAAKTALGEQTWGGIKAEYKKWNRIYQAAANILSSVQSISQSILSALEVVGSWIGSIGNALRAWGQVGERAYDWMNPNVDFQNNKFFRALETAENVISQVDQVASEVLSVQQTIQEIGQQKEELQKSLQQTDDSKQKNTPPEATKIKQAVDESKAASPAPILGIFDLDSDDDATTN